MLTLGILARTYDKSRIAGPMVRKSYLEGISGNRKPELRGKDEFVQVSWDVALGLTAKAILDTIEKNTAMRRYSVPRMTVGHMAAYSAPMYCRAASLICWVAVPLPRATIPAAQRRL